MNDEDKFALNNIIYSNNNNILFDGINKLETIVTDLNNNRQINIIIKEIHNIIKTMNNVINENRKNNAQIREDINKLNNDIINNNNIIKKTKLYKNGKYIGETKNDLREGKGIMYYNNGERYEGDYKNEKREGKGIFYNDNGDRYEGKWKNGLKN